MHGDDISRLSDDIKRTVTMLYADYPTEYADCLCNYLDSYYEIFEDIRKEKKTDSDSLNELHSISLRHILNLIQNEGDEVARQTAAFKQQTKETVELSSLSNEMMYLEDSVTFSSNYLKELKSVLTDLFDDIQKPETTELKKLASITKFLKVEDSFGRSGLESACFQENREKLKVAPISTLVDGVVEGLRGLL